MKHYKLLLIAGLIGSARPVVAQTGSRLTQSSKVSELITSEEFKKMPADMQAQIRRMPAGQNISALKMNLSNICSYCYWCCHVGPVLPMTGAVFNRTESAGNGVQIKLYMRSNLAKESVKGIVLMGAGNNESDPGTGDLNGQLENALCNKLAADNYVCAVVAYRDEPAVNQSDGGTSWNNNCAMLATDFSNVSAYIAGKYGGSKARTVVGGVSYTSFALLSNLALNNSPLLGCAGMLAACGSTAQWSAQNMKVPVANMVCAGGNEATDGNLTPEDLYNDLPASVKAKSECQTDATCSSHCGGTGSQKWLDFFYNKVKAWIP